MIGIATTIELLLKAAQDCLEKFWRPKAAGGILLSGYQTNMKIKLGDKYKETREETHNDNDDKSNKSPCKLEGSKNNFSNNK